MVGIETADDAAVYRLNDEQALIATTDFFMPIVDDPYDFGRIAATNAISDVYAMGGTPIMALALVGDAVNQLPLEVIGEIVRGGESVCREAGIPIAGRPHHRFGRADLRLVVHGPRASGKVRRNADAQAGDVLVLGKPLGVGVMSAALKKGKLDAAGYAQLSPPPRGSTSPARRSPTCPACTRSPTSPASAWPAHARAGARREADRRRSTGRGAAAPRRGRDGRRRLRHRRLGRNWAGYGAEVTLDPALGRTVQDLLTDPQTSGGLLVSCAAAHAGTVLQVFRDGGFDDAAVIGRVEAGRRWLRVRADRDRGRSAPYAGRRLRSSARRLGGGFASPSRYTHTSLSRRLRLQIVRSPSSIGTAMSAPAMPHSQPHTITERTPTRARGAGGGPAPMA
jgi:selenide,water dikinase